MTPEEFCKLVDEKLTFWLEVSMKGYTERQYRKSDIRDLRDKNPVRQVSANEPPVQEE